MQTITNIFSQLSVMGLDIPFIALIVFILTNILKKFVPTSRSSIIVLIPFVLGIIFCFPIGKLFTKKVNDSERCWLTLLEDFILGILFCLVIIKLVSNSYNPFIYFRF